MSNRYQQQQPQQPASPAPLPQFQKPQLSVSVWLLRNTVPVVLGSGPNLASSILQQNQQQQSGSYIAPSGLSTNSGHCPIECCEPSDLLYGCENDLLDAGTKPLTWGPQPSLHHVLNPKYFCGEALSALVIVRNQHGGTQQQSSSSSSSSHQQQIQLANAKDCKLRVELTESAQRKSIELLNTTIPSLVAGGAAEYRLFSRIVEPGIYAINAKVTAGIDFPSLTQPATSSSSSSSHNQQQQQQQQQQYYYDSNAIAVSRTFSVECDRGIEEASRRVIQLPFNSSSSPPQKAGTTRFMVLFCLKNASSTNSAAIQHVSLVSKDPSVRVLKSPAENELNASDAHMTELLRVPVCTGSSAADCIDSVMTAGEVRQFSWIVEVAPKHESSASAASSASSFSSSSSTTSNQQQQQQLVIGVVEWQWRRSGGDGGAIRSSTITTPFNPNQQLLMMGSITQQQQQQQQQGGTSAAAIIKTITSLSEIIVEAIGLSSSPCIVGEPCQLQYKVTNKAAVTVELNAHVEPSNLLPDFLFVGGSTCISLNGKEEKEKDEEEDDDDDDNKNSSNDNNKVIPPGESVILKIPVMPIQSGVFISEPAFNLRDASPPHSIFWNGARSNTASTNVVSMQAQ